MTTALSEIPIGLRPQVAQIKHLLGSFARHIGGRPHAACDRLHLRELITRLEALAPTVASLPSLHAAVGVRLDMLRTLASEIDKLEPPAAVEYSTHLATRANQQFSLFKRLVQGRTLVRPELVERITENLAHIKAEMEAIPSSSIANASYHETNLGLVARELVKIGETRETVTELPVAERVRVLATAANAEREDYKVNFQGRDRATVDLDRLGLICDRLGEITFQLAALPASAAEETLQQVAANLDAYEVEYNLCAELRKRVVTFAHVARSAEALRKQLLAADAPDGVRKQAVARLDELLADALVREMAGIPSN